MILNINTVKKSLFYGENNKGDSRKVLMIHLKTHFSLVGKNTHKIFHTILRV
jgi:hypothetical protein